MINLCSNIFVTYAHTKQFYYKTDGIIVSLDRLNHIVSSESKVLKQVKTLEELFTDSMQFFDNLINRINSDESHRIVLYMDPSSFQSFIVKWLYSAYRNADLETLKEIIKKQSELELARSGGLRFEWPDGRAADYETIHSLYWDIDESLIDQVHGNHSYYDVNLVFSERGYEHIIGNALLGDTDSIANLTSKLNTISKMALLREFNKAKFLFSERLITLAHSDSTIGDTINLGTDFHSVITGMHPSYPKLLSQFKNKTDLFDEEMESTIALVADLFSEVNPLEVPLCTYFKLNNRLPPKSDLLADILDQDNYELLYYYFGNNRYNPAWAEFIRSKISAPNAKMYMAFGPLEA